MSAADSPSNSLWLRPVEVKPSPSADAAARTPDVEVEQPNRSAPVSPVSVENPVVPEVPTTLAQTGLHQSVILGLVLKVLYAGSRTGRDLADEIKLSYLILEGVINPARLEQLIEIKSASGAGTAGYEYALTDRGRERAKQFFEVNGYVGPAPVPLDQYVAYLRELARHNQIIDRDVIAASFTDLVVADEMLDQLGPAVSTRRAMFLYGPPGNGKTVMSAGIGRALGGAVYVPYALELGGQVVTVFDPITHHPQPLADTDPLVRSESAHDPRWVRVRRPVITVGGELTIEQLDLKFNHLAKYYDAPVQLKANAGILLVDDFGRQRVPASELLNRWIVPLESRVDYLALHTGRKLEVPFDVLVVFATNLEPRSLADEAFLRRIPYKVHAANPTREQFAAIFRLVCSKYDIRFDPAVVDHLRREYYDRRGFEMRACHPRDLVEQMVMLCKYRKQPVAITPKLLDEVCRTYFLEKPLSGTAAVA